MKTAAYKFLPPELADRLRNSGISVRRPMEGGRQGQHKSPHHGSSVEFADYREYTRGDPPNLIDWAVYARTDRYVIRRYQEETSMRAFVLLDTSESMNFKDEGIHTKMDYACYLAASFAYVLVSQSDSVGMMFFNDDIHRMFQPTGNLEGLRPLLLGLEDIQPSGRSKIEEAMHKVAEQVKSRSLIILISDLLNDTAGTLRGIRHLHHNGHEVTVMHVLDPAEIRLTFAGLVELKELETSHKLVVQADEIRDAYAHEVQRFIERLSKGCMDCLADYHLVETRKSIEDTMHMRVTRS
ncbi:MAG: DUF58 domain-containing protein [Verrucomicrobiota bacterium]